MQIKSSKKIMTEKNKRYSWEEKERERNNEQDRRKSSIQWML